MSLWHKYIATQRLNTVQGTYDDGLTWLKRSENSSMPKCIMSLGSSIGNFSRADASSFLGQFANILDPGRDYLLIGLDGCQDSSRVYVTSPFPTMRGYTSPRPYYKLNSIFWYTRYKAYNDERGTTRQFILNGLAHANRILGEEVFKAEEWEYGTLQYYLSPLDVSIWAMALRANNINFSGRLRQV